MRKMKLLFQYLRVLFVLPGVEWNRLLVVSTFWAILLRATMLPW